MLSEGGEGFANKPFAGLMRPAKREAPAENGIDPRDRELFLREVWKKPPRKRKPAPGFALAERCRLPEIKMKKKKPAVPPPAAPPPQPLPPPEPEDDGDLFALAARGAAPLPANKGRAVAPAKPAIRRPPAPKEEDFAAANLEFAVSASDEYVEGYVAGLDQLAMGRLREGGLSPEAHLDLHGLNAEQAFESLKEFLLQAWRRNLRCVLVVTGRGRNSLSGLGVLRQKLPYWLTHEPFKRVVTAFCTAQPRDGGPGSVYVLLRKSRKKGPVRWETLAYDSDVF